jgi:NADP-dependent 3-hydroxy acid dehydrogenase YdfG
MAEPRRMILITGAAGGIGHAVRERLTRAGCPLLLAALGTGIGRS